MINESTQFRYFGKIKKNFTFTLVYGSSVKYQNNCRILFVHATHEK